jgi:hypothetical protein
MFRKLIKRIGVLGRHMLLLLKANKCHKLAHLVKIQVKKHKGIKINLLKTIALAFYLEKIFYFIITLL